MKKIVYLTIIMMAIVCGADAYIINFDVPSEVNLGDTISIQGTSTINPGITMTIVLYSQEYTIQEIERKSFTIQSDGTWSVTFETENLNPGSYKLEIPSNDEVGLGSSSTKYKSFKLIDRTGEIIITSPLTQDYNGNLLVEGRSTTRENLGIEIMVKKGDEIILSPQWISTNTNGEFSKNVEIFEPGSYYVSFLDNIGLVRLQKFSSVKTTPTPDTAGTTAPAETQTPDAGKPMVAQSFASYNSPAYFAVQTKPGTLQIDTSEGHNWVLEYTDESRTLHKVNSYQDKTAESFAIPVTGGTVYIKAYPSDISDSGYVTIYASGATTITVTGDASAYFTTENTPVPTQSGSFFPIGLISCLTAFSFIALAARRQ